MSPTRIESLTSSQEADLIAFREECLAYGRSCEPADRPRAEMAISELYAALGHRPPRVWWVDGPATGSLIRTLVSANLRDNLGANLGANLGDNLRANLRANLRDNIGDNLRANLRDNLGANLFWYFWGQHEIYWIAYYIWPDGALRPMHTEGQLELLGHWLALSRSAGWWQPYENICFVCDRPKRQEIDMAGRLHNENGPAILCRDGWPVYAWHGVRIDARVIEKPETITVDEIRAEQNAEIRRVMIFRYGPERFLRDSGAIPKQDDGYGELFEIPGPAGAEKWVRVVNGSAEPDGSYRDFLLPTFPDVQTAQEAVARSYGMQANDYAPALRT